MLKKEFFYSIGLAVFVLLNINLEASGLKVKEVGLKTGISLTKFSNSYDFDNMNFNTQTNLTLGVYYSVEFGKNLFSQTEIFISEKGTNMIGVDNNIKYSLLYIDSFHLVKYRFPLNLKSRINLLIGPYYSVILSGKAIIESDNIIKTINLRDVFNINDWGLIFGANFETRLMGKTFLFELRYNFGICRVFDSNIYEISELNFSRKKHITIKNRSINFLIGYRF